MHQYNTMTEAIEGLGKRGFTLNFEFLHNSLRAVDTGRDFRAEELTIVEHHRFEGITNPSDESIVYALQSSDGARGVLVDAYGIYADPDLAAFLDRVAMREEP